MREEVCLWTTGNLVYKLGHNNNEASLCIKHSQESTSTAGQDWVAGLDLPSYLKQSPKWTTIWSNGFQDIVHKQQRTVISEKQKANEVNPAIAPAYCI